MESSAKHDRDVVARHLLDLLDGDVLFDDLTRAIYSTAADIHRIWPLGVVAPKGAEDVVRLVQYAAEQQIPLTARGGGSALSGQTVGEGIIVDFRRHMRRVCQVDPGEKWVRVQPGAFRTELSRVLAPYGLQFPPDPSSTDFCSIGGMIANNSSGPQSVKYGSTKDYLLSLDLVLADSSTAVADGGQQQAEGPLAGLAAQVRDALVGREQAIQANWPQVKKNSSGYLLPETLNAGEVDLRQLMAASEGTLALITEAKLSLVPVQPHVAAGILHFPSRRAAAEAIEPLLELEPVGLELMDATLIRVIREVNPELRPLLPEECRCALLVEFESQEQDEPREQLARAEQLASKELGLATGMQPAFGAAERDRLWAVRRAAMPLVNRLPGKLQAVVFIEDPAVMPERLPELTDGLEAIFADHGVEASILGHAGSGNIHVRPIMDLRKPEDVRKVESIAEANCELLKSLNGSLSGEHGDGLCATPFLPRMFGEAYPLFERIKETFDPEGILNPGKIVGEPGRKVTDDLRFGYDYRTVPTNSAFDREKLAVEAEKCHGCGTCQFYCPMARELAAEPATARAKAALLREVIRGNLDTSALESPEFKQIMDLCFNCKLCLQECPTGINVPDLALRARAHYVQAHGQTLQNRLLADSRRAGAVGKTLAPLSNAAARIGPLRWLMDKAAGLSSERELPAFNRERFGPKGLPPGATPRGKVAYFAGCFANYHDPGGEGACTVAILERHGFEVVVPDLRCCGAAQVTVGSLGPAIEAAEENISKLKQLVDKGHQVVSSASTCSLMLKLEYPELLETDDARLVSENTHDVHAFLLDLHERGELDTRFGPLGTKLAYHSPCHLTAQGLAEAPVRLLELIPDLTVPEIEDTCCGIAGTFGMKSQHFELSMRIGRPLFEQLKATGADLVVSPCGTCKMQIEQATGLPVVHTLEILQRSYEVAAQPELA
ncbi:MAG: anaerobic glycerol-3-phosphate dehydrogenase subunit C [Armatimonadota bacterium]